MQDLDNVSVEHCIQLVSVRTNEVVDWNIETSQPDMWKDCDEKVIPIDLLSWKEFGGWYGTESASKLEAPEAGALVLKRVIQVVYEELADSTLVERVLAIEANELPS